jgi:hypothetical protein
VQLLDLLKHVVKALPESRSLPSAILHSAKPLPSITLGKEYSAKGSLSSTFIGQALGKLRIEKNPKKNRKTFFKF